MGNKLRKKTVIPIADKNKKTKHIKIRYLMVALIMAGAVLPISQNMLAKAAGCPSLRIVFARGSGGERWNTDDYFEFKNTLESKLMSVDLDYEFVDLDYPAVGVGYDNIQTTIGAYVGGAESYEFGKSVKSGVNNLDKLVNNSCPNTKYVLGGYSQGAIVVSKSLPLLNPDKLIYAATFGDPKIYLPEGEGFIPPACRGEQLSDYRMYVPDCQAYKGLLGAFVPYEPTQLAGKVGTWCNKKDIFCSSHYAIPDHLSYISDGLYEDASKVIFNKIATSFGLENTVVSPHDTVILIDSTGSMSDLIESYKAEALRLAEQTFAANGRVALFDYRDLNDPYQPIEHCNFETCNLDVFRSELESITVDGGGDEAESLLSAAFHTMNALEWKNGATKSLVVLTDSNFLAPDRDGISLNDVVKLSKEIDPVNFYVITRPEFAETYQELATATDGKVVTDLGQLDLLTDYIMERYDSLPRVEENTEHATYALEITDVARQEDGSFVVKFDNEGAFALVVLNDVIIGRTNEGELTISGLNLEVDNELTLVPLIKGGRGEAVQTVLTKSNEINNENAIIGASDYVILPKTPNTGSR